MVGTVKWFSLERGMALSPPSRARTCLCTSAPCNRPVCSHSTRARWSSSTWRKIPAARACVRSMCGHGRALGCAGSANGLYQSLARQGHRWPYLKRTAAVVRGAPRVRVLVAVMAEGDEHPDGIGWRLAVAALAAEHRAGQGAGDAGDGLDAGDDQPAQLVHPWRLSPGDAVVGAGDGLGQLHPLDGPDCLGDLGCLADLGLDEHVRAEHLALTSRRPPTPPCPGQVGVWHGWPGRWRG